eukprot:TRINITY_DN34114_c0_g1_i1.p2 TRINITY_DN34114_c0_g1~~TRINITY_DN34114_c0_g1_i1.p2  ORF type:complete len:245 (-),score=76.52 TRINITY_DN34114_c0_g1_i1:342-1076(-)
MPASASKHTSGAMVGLSLGLPQPAEVKREFAKKARGLEADDLDNEAEKMDVQKLALLAVTTAAGLEGVRAAVQDGYLVPADGNIGKAALSATKTYYNAVKKLPVKERSSYGPPYDRVWAAILEAGLTEAARLGDNDHYTPNIKPFVDQIQKVQEAKRVDVTMESVRQCVAALTFKKDKVKIIVSVQTDGNIYVDEDDNHIGKAWVAIQRLMVLHCGAEKKAGSAPRSNVARDLQAFKIKAKQDD